MASVLVNTFISVFGRFGGVTVGLIITGVLGRVLGVEGFGDYSLLLSFGALLHIITDGGLYLTLVRGISKDIASTQDVFEVISGLRVALFVGVFGVGALLLFLFPQYRHFIPLYSLAAAGFLFQSLSQLLMAIFQANGTMWRAASGDIVGRIVQLVVVIVFAVGFGASINGVTWAVIAFVLGAAVAYGVHAYSIRRYVYPWRLAGSIPKWKSIMTDAWPLGAMLILNAIYFRTDILMVSWFRGASEVGLYGFAYRIIESALFFPAAFGGLLLPKIVAATTNREKGKLIEQALLVMMIVGGLLYAIVPSQAQDITVLLVGSQFAPAAPILSILITALVIMFLGNIFGFALVAYEEQRLLLKLYGWLAIGNVLANFLFIPQFGAVAAAWTTVITEAAATIAAGVFVARRTTYVLPWRAVISIVACVMISTMALQAASRLGSVILTITVGAGVYGGALFFLGMLRRNHISLLLKAHE